MRNQKSIHSLITISELFISILNFRPFVKFHSCTKYKWFKTELISQNIYGLKKFLKNSRFIVDVLQNSFNSQHKMLMHEVWPLVPAGGGGGRGHTLLRESAAGAGPQCQGALQNRQGGEMVFCLFY